MNHRHTENARSTAEQFDYAAEAKRGWWLTWLIWAATAGVVLDVIVRLSRYF